MVDARRIGLLGGTFNPIHLGHLLLAERAREELNLDSIDLLPSGNPPHKSSELAPAPDRLEMVRLATDGNPRLSVRDLEVARGGTTYTIDTMRQIHAGLPFRPEIYFLIGADSVPELPTWKEIDQLFQYCHLVTLRRPGETEQAFEQLEGKIPTEALADLRNHRLLTPRIEISSSEIRDRIRRNRSIRYLVPEPVRRYIEQRGLYRDTAAN